MLSRPRAASRTCPTVVAAARPEAAGQGARNAHTQLLSRLAVRAQSAGTYATLAAEPCTRAASSAKTKQPSKGAPPGAGPQCSAALGTRPRAPAAAAGAGRTPQSGPAGRQLGFGSTHCRQLSQAWLAATSWCPVQRNTRLTCMQALSARGASPARLEVAGGHAAVGRIRAVHKHGGQVAIALQHYSSQMWSGRNQSSSPKTQEPGRHCSAAQTRDTGAAALKWRAEQRHSV